jgi:hypothetical protein
MATALPWSLVGASELMQGVSPQTKHSLDDQRVVVEVQGPGEWIVGTSSGGRSLHIYRVAQADWLVSEVGRGNEGRGADLPQALGALSAGGSASGWWSSVPAALDGERHPGC